MSLPTLDLRRLDRGQDLQPLDEACREWGFFELTGHGLDEERQAQLLQTMHAFFRRPTVEKRLSAEGPLSMHMAGRWACGAKARERWQEGAVESTRGEYCVCF